MFLSKSAIYLYLIIASVKSLFILYYLLHKFKFSHMFLVQYSIMVKKGKSILLYYLLHKFKFSHMCFVLFNTVLWLFYFYHLASFLFLLVNASNVGGAWIICGDSHTEAELTKHHGTPKELWSHQDFQ